jgi:hypothetical protein
VYELTRDVEAKAGSGWCVRQLRISAEELFENPALITEGDARPLICDRNADRAIRCLDADAHLTGATILDRIVQEIQEHLTESVGIA